MQNAPEITAKRSTLSGKLFGTDVGRAPGWRPDIDGLRAIAVLSVVLYHALPSVLPGGFVGVDVFFVISGYLITGILLKEHAAGRFSLLRFYERRARRLFPALAVVLLVTVILAFFFAFPSQAIQTAKHGVASAFSVANIAFWREAGYFDTASHLKPFLNLWSLGVEEQFYLVWPLLLAVLLRSKYVGALIAVGCLGSLFAAEAFNETEQAAVFYLPHFRAWELGLGAGLAVLDARGNTSERFVGNRVARFAISAGVLLIVATVLLLDSRTPFPGFSAVAPVFGSALILWVGNRQPGTGGAVGGLLSSRFFVYTGLISYSLYLWHWPLLVLPTTAGLELDDISRLAIVALAYVLAAATLKWIERPVRDAAAPRRAALMACISLAAAATVSLGAYVYEKRSDKSEARAALARALWWPSREARRKNCPEEIADLNPPLMYCRTGAPENYNSIIWGDSHADHLYPGLAEAGGRRWLFLGHAACPPTAGIEVIAAEGRCRVRSEAALAWIEKQSEVDTVLLGFYGHYFESTDVAQAHRDNPVGPAETRIDGSFNKEKKRAAFARGLERTVRRLTAAGKTVVVVIDVPELTVAPQNCFTTPRVPLKPQACSVPMEQVRARQKALREIVVNLARKYPKVRIVDPVPVLCNEAACGPGTMDALTYRDSHHLSAYGSQLVAAQIVRSMNSQ